MHTFANSVDHCAELVTERDWSEPEFTARCLGKIWADEEQKQPDYYFSRAIK